MKRSGMMVVISALVACTSSSSSGPDVELPSADPPAPWGAPISGGTMLVTRDGARAVIGDPDRDRIVIVDLGSETELASIPLPAGSEPGRGVEDGAQRIHVALRGSGELLTLTNEGPQRRAICAEPRGVAWEATGDLVHVACATGELVSVPAAGGAPLRVLRLERDLRDVIVRDAGLVVTTFRSAEVLTLDASGSIVRRVKPPITQRLEGGPPCVAPPCIFADDGMVDALPAVAWRTIALPDGRLLMSHQRKLDSELAIVSGGYTGSCGGGPVESAITVFTPDKLNEPPHAVAPMVFGALPVDVAVSADGYSLAFVAAASQMVHVIASPALATPDSGSCGGGSDQAVFSDELGAPTSVAFASNGRLLTYYPELPALVIRVGETSRTVRLSGDIGYDAGRGVFHRRSGVGIACASCHPEGREDGQVWTFEELGPRRTQSLAGGILERGPYHWDGDMVDLTTLMDKVFSERMLGGTLTRSEHLSLGPWLDRLRAPAGIVGDTAMVERGKLLFESQATQCANCHEGRLFTNNMRVNVGTGGMFKVPSLAGVGARAPFMHNGCAATLRDRFTCGGGDMHGRTSQLTAEQLADLVAYLESI